MSLALVAEPVRLLVGSQSRLVERNRLGQGHPQGVQVRLLGESPPAPHPGVYLDRLGFVSTHRCRDWKGQATQAERSKGLS